MSNRTCSALSLAAGEPLAGTAGRADAFLLLEVRGAWGRDALDSLAGRPGAAIQEWLGATPRSKVLLIRRPDRRNGELAAFVVTPVADEPTVRRLRLATHDDLADLDLNEGGEFVSGPLALVCGHGRRDACCARLGRPLYDALRAEFGPEELWLSTHQGGHRFAPNLLWLPDALMFGRVDPAGAVALVSELRAGRLPLPSLRGRTIFAPEAQAAEIAVRRKLGLARLADVELVSGEGGRVRLATSAGAVEVEVETWQGPPLPASCGAEPEPGFRYAVTTMRP